MACQDKFRLPTSQAAPYSSRTVLRGSCSFFRAAVPSRNRNPLPEAGPGLAIGHVPGGPDANTGSRRPRPSGLAGEVQDAARTARRAFAARCSVPRQRYPELCLCHSGVLWLHCAVAQCGAQVPSECGHSVQAFLCLWA